MAEDALEQLSEKDPINDLLCEESCRKNKENKLCFCGKKLYAFCEAYGSIAGYYLSVSGVLSAAIVSPIINEFQGGCLYPYVSEVTRSGIGWYLFFIASLIGGIPWMVFAIHNFKVNVRFARQSSSVLYQVIHVFIMLFHILAAFGMICTAFFDMGDFPLCHEISVALFSIPLNLAAIMTCTLMKWFSDRISTPYFCLYLLTITVSLGGMILFVILGRIDYCKSVTLTIENCLRQTAESVCFDNLSVEIDGYTVIRYYPHCRNMHFWRGFIEYISLLASTQLLLFMYYDRNAIQSLVTQCFQTAKVTATKTAKKTAFENEFVIKEIKEDKQALVHNEEQLVI